MNNSDFVFHLFKSLFVYRLPKLQVIGEGSEKDIEISDDPYDTVPLDISNVPILVTLNKVVFHFSLF